MGSNLVRIAFVCVFVLVGAVAPSSALGTTGLSACFAEAPHLANPAYAWLIKDGQTLRSTDNRAVLARIGGLSGRAIYTGQNEREPFETRRAEWSVAFQFFVVSDPANVGPGAWDSIWFYEVASRPDEYYVFGYSYARLHYINPKTGEREQHPCAAFAVSRAMIGAIVNQMR